MLQHFIQRTASFLKNPSIPIPEEDINRVLPYAIQDVKEIQSLRVAVYDGYFDATAHLSTEVLYMNMQADATVRFAIEEACISVDEQWIVLRQVGKVVLRGHDLVDEIAASVIEAILFSLLDIDPVAAATQGLPNVRRDKDRYHVDISTMLPADAVAKYRKPWMRAGRIREILCKPQCLELMIAIKL